MKSVSKMEEALIAHGAVDVTDCDRNRPGLQSSGGGTTLSATEQAPHSRPSRPTSGVTVLGRYTHMSQWRRDSCPVSIG